MASQGNKSRVEISIDLAAPGRQTGDLRVKWSDNRQPVGYYPVPIICLANGDGPTVLLTGGVHGDEFEGPAALMRLAHALEPRDLKGRVIIIPALNAPALYASSRISPLDQMNLNRAFPGDANGTATQMIAHFVESRLLPECDAAIDLHAGGKAAIFAACVLAEVAGSTALAAANLALAKAFAAPYLWVASEKNDDRSLNAAARRQQLPMIAAELGGGGGCDPQMTRFTEAALGRCLDHLGITDSGQQGETGDMIALQVRNSFCAPAAGLLERNFAIGDEVSSGQVAGWLHFIQEPERAPLELVFPAEGIILAHGNRGLVERGDLVAVIAGPAQIEGMS